MSESARRILPERASAFHRWCLDQQPNTSPSRVITTALSDRSWPLQSSKLCVLLEACSNLGERLDVKRAHRLWRHVLAAQALEDRIDRAIAERPDLARLAIQLAHKAANDLRDIKWDVRS